MDFSVKYYYFNHLSMDFSEFLLADGNNIFANIAIDSLVPTSPDTSLSPPHDSAELTNKQDLGDSLSSDSESSPNLASSFVGGVDSIASSTDFNFSDSDFLAFSEYLNGGGNASPVISDHFPVYGGATATLKKPANIKEPVMFSQAQLNNLVHGKPRNIEPGVFRVNQYGLEPQMNASPFIRPNKIEQFSGMTMLTGNESPSLEQFSLTDNGIIKKSMWTAQEDEMLIKAYTMFPKQWVKISSMLPGRTNQQVKQRWSYVLNKDIKNGSWSEEEDRLLAEGYSIFGKQWAKIAQHIPGRTNIQCRNRWKDVLDPSIRTAPWSFEEDEILLRGYSQLGNRWTKIASLIPGRTGLQCRDRFLRRHLKQRRVSVI